MHLDRPGKGQFRPHMSGDGGGECKLFLSQPTPLASGVDGPCSYSTAVLGSAKAVSQSSICLWCTSSRAKYDLVVICLIVKVFISLCRMM